MLSCWLPGHGARRCRYASVRATVIAFAMTFFSIFNIPVFWPILVLYFLLLLGMNTKKQIAHMIKYRYVPFSFGKKK